MGQLSETHTNEYICRMPTRCTSSSYVWTNQYPMALALPPKFNEVDIRNETLLRQVRAKSELGDLLVEGLGVDTRRFRREFSNPPPNRLGYYPDVRLTAHLNPPPPSSPTCP